LTGSSIVGDGVTVGDGVGGEVGSLNVTVAISKLIESITMVMPPGKV